jgi:uncharacterized tellurite resistance protein B-like protein
MVSIFIAFSAVVCIILLIGSLKADEMGKAVSVVSASLFGRPARQEDREQSSESNQQGIKRLGIMLALAVGAADDVLNEAEFAVIKKWADENIKFEGGKFSRFISRRRLKAALNEAADFFYAGNQFDIHSICKELTQTATAANKYDILELCLCVVGADGLAAERELEELQRCAWLLGAEEDKFRSMMERILPVTVHEKANEKLLLGLRPNMKTEEVRKGLNKEYRKWNARTANRNPDVQEQAEQMLRLIADTRKRYMK